MKKTYEKPMVYFEDMSLDTAIASTCTSWYYMNQCQTNAATGDECSKFMGATGKIYFASEKEICEDGAFMCYHASAASYGLTNQS